MNRVGIIACIWFCCALVVGISQLSRYGIFARASGAGADHRDSRCMDIASIAALKRELLRCSFNEAIQDTLTRCASACYQTISSFERSEVSDTPREILVDDVAQSAGSFGSYGSQGSSLIPFNTQPIYTDHFVSGSYGPVFDKFANVFASSKIIRSTTTAPAVTFYSAAEAAGSGSRVWGGNIASIVNSPGAVGVALELDINMPQPGTGTGLSVNAVGPFKAESAYEMSSNTLEGGFRYGIDFNNTRRAAVSDALIYGINNKVKDGILLTGSFSNSELTLPSFIVGPTAAKLTTALRVVGGDSEASLAAVGSTEKADLNLLPKGSGQVVVRNAVLRQGLAEFHQPLTKGDITFEVTEDSLLTLKVMGGDGVVRKAQIRLRAE